MNITCDHCDSEIDVAKDPRCVVYDPSGDTEVICENCKERAFQRWQAQSLDYWPLNLTEQLRAAYRVKRGWRA